MPPSEGHSSLSAYPLCIQQFEQIKRPTIPLIDPLPSLLAIRPLGPPPTTMMMFASGYSSTRGRSRKAPQGQLAKTATVTLREQLLQRSPLAQLSRLSSAAAQPAAVQ